MGNDELSKENIKETKKLNSTSFPPENYADAPFNKFNVYPVKMQYGIEQMSFKQLKIIKLQPKGPIFKQNNPFPFQCKKVKLFPPPPLMDPPLEPQIFRPNFCFLTTELQPLPQPQTNKSIFRSKSPVQRWRPPAINRLLQPTFPKYQELSGFNSFNIDYSNILGKGPFGIVYSGNNKFTNEKVAVKMEFKDFFHSYILNEIDIYKKIGSYYNSIPKIYWSGSTMNHNVIIMEILGDSLEKKIRQYREYNKQFSLSETINIGIKILKILECIHNKNIIHRDIKTHCFLLKNDDLSQIYIVNFGNAKEYINSITGKHIPFTKGSNYIGDYKFASKNAFLGYEMSRRDDIESLGYILIYLLVGYLPWNEFQDFYYIKNWNYLFL